MDLESDSESEPVRFHRSSFEGRGEVEREPGQDAFPLWAGVPEWVQELMHLLGGPPPDQRRFVRVLFKEGPSAAARAPAALPQDLPESAEDPGAALHELAEDPPSFLHPQGGEWDEWKGWVGRHLINFFWAYPDAFFRLVRDVWKVMLQARADDGTWWLRMPIGQGFIQLAVYTQRPDILQLLLAATNDGGTPRAYDLEKEVVRPGAFDSELWILPANWVKQGEHWQLPPPRGWKVVDAKWRRSSPPYQRLNVSRALMHTIENDDAASAMVLLTAKTPLPPHEPVIEPPSLIFAAIVKGAFNVIQAVLQSRLRSIYAPGLFEVRVALECRHPYIAEWFLRAGAVPDAFMRSIVTRIIASERRYEEEEDPVHVARWRARLK